MLVRDVMRSSVFTIGETDCLGHAYSTMNRSHIRHLPVVSSGALVGILSERDILKARARVDDANWWNIPVREAMTQTVDTAGPDEAVDAVALRMAEKKVGSIPIVDWGKVVGIVTVGDVLAAEASALPVSPTLTVADAMTAYPRTVRPDEPLASAIRLMVAHRVRHLPVVAANGSYAGLLSESDVRTAVGDPRAPLRSELQVQHVMSRSQTPVAHDLLLGDLARRFADDRLEAAVVIDPFGAVVGIISYVDVLRWLAN